MRDGRLSLEGLRADSDQRVVEGEILQATSQTPLTEDELLAGVESRTAIKRAALRSLTARGDLARLGGGRRGDPYRYCRQDSRFLVPT